MAKRPTQVDVAKLAGVSRATVSYVLNKRTRRDIPISDDTKEKVLAAARQLGYEPNALARSLRAGQSHIIGVLTPNIHNLHYLEILEGVEEELANNGYYLSIVSSNFDLERERDCLRSLFQRRLDGLILMPTFWDLLAEEIEMIADRPGAAVFLTQIPDVDWVAGDLLKGAKLMMDHLLSLGHQRIGFINGVVRPELTQQRLATYFSKLEEAGIVPDKNLVRYCGHKMQDGYEAAKTLLNLDRQPTAIWTINDLLAVGALRAIHERGLRIPEDIALAGFDDTALASQLYPRLTSVKLPSHSLGKYAVQIILQRIDDPSQSTIQELLDVELVIRESTDLSLKPPAAGSP